MNRRFSARVMANRFGNISNNFRPASEVQTTGGSQTNTGQGICEAASMKECKQSQETLDSYAMETSDTPDKPTWMKPKLAGVKKVTNRERRRRQNVTLRRLLAPKNALMVLNEMMPGEQLHNQFKVDAAKPANVYRNQHQPSFCADLKLDQQVYKGYGDNKLAARNAAAEQAIRDLILKRMSNMEDPTASEEELPMIQLASFALHKLFSEWELEGHRVPQLRLQHVPHQHQQDAVANIASVAHAPKPAEEKKEKKPRLLPENARSMHPCTLLTYMKPGLSYQETGVEGDKPQNTKFTISVEVEGHTFSGTANNKKEARKNAAAEACKAVYGVVFQQ